MRTAEEIRTELLEMQSLGFELAEQRETADKALSQIVPKVHELRNELKEAREQEEKKDNGKAK